MNRFSITYASFIFALALGLAPVPGASAADPFCARTLNDIKQAAQDPAMRLSFSNQGGAFSSGVCWWLSRFQRAALYLARFYPELPKPTADEARKLIRRLAQMNEVVEIPGYRNIFDFSCDFSTLIQRRLERWQILDGIFRFAWIEGIRGKSALPN
ncbi:hypothetical protein WDW86_08600 [Bdellovibrionota bacterium FG-2]